jgi:hypothetical protein
VARQRAVFGYGELQPDVQFAQQERQYQAADYKPDGINGAIPYRKDSADCIAGK